MHGCCGAALLQPLKVRAPSASVPLWLAVTFHAGPGVSGVGSEAVSSSTVQNVFRSDVAARTRATSAG